MRQKLLIATALIVAGMLAAFAKNFSDNILRLGTGASTADTEIISNQPGTNDPKLKYDSTLGQWVKSDDGVNESPLGSGSGGGGLNFNNAFTSSQNANAESGTTGWAATGGTLAATSTDPLEGNQSFTYTPSAQNDYVEGPVLDVDKAIFHGKACQAQIDYIGGDENLSLKVLDADDDVLAEETFEAGVTLSAVKNIFFLCPSSGATANDLDLRIRIENTGASAAPLIKFDKAYLGTLIGLSESTLPDVFSAYVLSTDVVSSESSDFINGDCTDATLGQSDCLFNPGIFSVAPSCQATATTAQGLKVDCSVVANTSGAFVFCHDDQDASSNFVDTDFYLSCQKQGADAKQSVQVYKSIPKVSENVNEFSAFVGSAGAVQTENTNWINGNCTLSGTATYTCDITPMGATIAPSCTCTVDHTEPNARVCTVDAISSTSFSYHLNGVDNVPEARNHHIRCQKQGTDFKLPTVQPILVNQVKTSRDTGLKVDMGNIGCLSAGSTLTQTGNIFTGVGNRSGALCTLTVDTSYTNGNQIRCFADVNSSGDLNAHFNGSASAIICTNQSGSGVDCSIDFVCYTEQ